LNPPTAVNLPVIKLLKTCSLERRVTRVPLAVFPWPSLDKYWSSDLSGMKVNR
jgi:hypothetical protein